MNARIKQLIEQAGGYVSLSNGHDGNLILSGEEVITKYTELIVKECLTACSNHDDIDRFGIYPIRVVLVTDACRDNIKRHFGFGVE